MFKLNKYFEYIFLFVLTFGDGEMAQQVTYYESIKTSIQMPDTHIRP